MIINYEHQNNIHTQEGACASIPLIFYNWKPKSLLDIGCGLGVWLKAALGFGISDVFGVDGVAIAQDQLLIPSELFQQHDLTLPMNLDRRFDVVICLEVAEHLDPRSGITLIQTITNHTDFVVFSAAPPWQSGQHHINCQLPAYWQELFNQAGFVCSDEVRWQLWNNSEIEPWYRQNMFIAQRNQLMAGKEDRIQAVVHPDLLPFIKTDLTARVRSIAELEQLLNIENGVMSVTWYLKASFQGLGNKVKRRISMFNLLTN